MKIRTLIVASLLLGTLFTSCKKDMEDVLDPNTPVKYLLRTDGYSAVDGEVITSHAYYHYDGSDRLTSRRLQTYIDGVLDADDSVTFVYTGSVQSPSKVTVYDRLGSSEQTIFLYYNSDGDLVKDSVENYSASYYTYDGTKTYVTHNTYGFVTNDVLTLNTDGNYSSVVFGETETSNTTFTFQFNKSVLSPWWFNGSTVGKYMAAHEDDIEGILSPFGKNVFTKMTIKYVDTDPIDPYNESFSLNLKYENISGGYPGKMTLTDPTTPGASYQLTFTYR